MLKEASAGACMYVPTFIIAFSHEIEKEVGNEKNDPKVPLPVYCMPIRYGRDAKRKKIFLRSIFQTIGPVANVREGPWNHYFFIRALCVPPSLGSRRHWRH